MAWRRCRVTPRLTLAKFSSLVAIREILIVHGPKTPFLGNQAYGRSRRSLGVSALLTATVSEYMRLFRLDFFLRRWLLSPFMRRALPPPEKRKRALAPLWVFSFGIIGSFD